MLNGAIISSQFIRFCVVGAAGFATDATLLFILVSIGVDPYAARVISFAAAVSATWLLNREWTFRRHDASARPHFWRYLSVQLAAMAVNFAVYAAVLSVISPTPVNALVALSAGAAVSVFLNFAGARFLVFTAPEKP